MDPNLEGYFNTLQQKRNSFLARLGTIPQLKLEASLDGGWSVSQVFHHLNTAESLSILYVQKKMQGGDALPSPGLIQALKLWYAGIRFARNVKYKAPKVLGEIPSHVSYTDIVKEWDQTRVRMQNLLENFPPKLIYKSVYKQPALGYLNLVQMLKFITMHEDKHYRQIISHF